MATDYRLVEKEIHGVRVWVKVYDTPPYRNDASNTSRFHLRDLGDGRNRLTFANQRSRKKFPSPSQKKRR